MENKREVNLRKLFVGVDELVELNSGKQVVPICFDNAATTPPFKVVQECVENIMPFYGCIGRGKGQKACICTKIYESSRERVLQFFNLKDSDEYLVIYVKNTTEGINLLSNVLLNENNKVLTTRMEHHANDLPWRARGNVFYVDVDKSGKINIDEVEEALIKHKGEIKVLSITGASNVTGYINPINELAEIAHKYGAKIIVDGAQLVAHKAIDMKGTKKDDYIDFLVFSAHKMYAPFGSGVIVGRKEYMEKEIPFIKGGGAVDLVLDDKIYWEKGAAKFEAGTPNIMGVVAIVAAMNELSKVGFDYIEKHEIEMRDYLLKGLNTIPNLTLYGDSNERERLAIACFNLNNVFHVDLAKSLAEIRGIAVRDGAFCAHPYVRRLLGLDDAYMSKFIYDKSSKRPGMIRCSLGLYNNNYEIDEFLNVLEYISKKY